MRATTTHMLEHLLLLALGVAGIWAAWSAAAVMAQHGHGLLAQALAGLGAYLAVTGGAGLLLDYDPLDTIAAATSVLRGTAVTVVAAVLTALVSAIGLVLAGDDQDEPATAAPAAADYAKTA